jgi:ubiquinone biosynthesis monooxygenase Coq7
VRPSALSPLWHLAGFALGATSAALGSRAAMAVTVAVEDVIEEHYRGQIERLPEGPIRDTLARFRADEIAHRDEALMHDATSAPGFGVLSGAVKAGSRLAIWLATRI